jgi:hypothetical protein
MKKLKQQEAISFFSLKPEVTQRRQKPLKIK